MPIKMCIPVLSSAPKQKHTLGSNLVSELDTILKFRIVSLWVGLRTETLTFQASELEPESQCLESFFKRPCEINWIVKNHNAETVKFLTESETSSRHVVSLKSRNRTRTHVWSGNCLKTLGLSGFNDSIHWHFAYFDNLLEEVLFDAAKFNFFSQPCKLWALVCMARAENPAVYVAHIAYLQSYTAAIQLAVGGWGQSIIIFGPLTQTHWKSSGYDISNFS